MNKTTSTILVLVIIAFGAYWFISGDEKSDVSSVDVDQNEQIATALKFFAKEKIQSEDVVIRQTADGYEPFDVEVSVRPRVCTTRGTTIAREQPVSIGVACGLRITRGHRHVFPRATDGVEGPPTQREVGRATGRWRSTTGRRKNNTRTNWVRRIVSTTTSQKHRESDDESQSTHVVTLLSG